MLSQVMNGVMTSIFTSIDADGDGMLDPKELLMFLTGLAPADDPPDEGQVHLFILKMGMRRKFNQLHRL